MSTPERRPPPLDQGDLILHVIATIGAAVAASALIPAAEGLGIGVVIAGSAALLSWRRSSRRGPTPDSHDIQREREHSARMEVLEQRMQELEEVHTRVFDLEERVDFAERLLVRPVSDSKELRS